VGKTYAMLAEGRRRAEAGEQVLVGWLERHGRAETRAQVGELKVAPTRTVVYRGVEFSDLDVDAVIGPGPDVALVDELAHTVPDGSRQRWEDVADILAAGIDVLTTVNVANLISTRDYAARIAGSGTVESVPDEFVRSGDVVLVDVPAPVLRQRIASGRIYSAEGVGGALAGYFRVCNLEALSELARAWIDGTLEEVAADLLVRHGLDTAASRPLVVAGVSDSAWGQRVIGRAAELAIADDADLLVVHVNPVEGLRQRDAVLDRYRTLTAELGGSFIEVPGRAPSDTLADVARARQATRVVVAQHRSRLGELTHGSVSARLRRLLPDVAVEEVHGDT
jgi:two-component system sensor histidine kinase KdpD